jgi:CheY-like chemotaxis protein
MSRAGQRRTTTPEQTRDPAGTHRGGALGRPGPGSGRYLVDSVDRKKISRAPFGRGAYADAPRPGLILLDLNLPKMDGREVLAEIKTDEGLRSIPVVVLTTSSAEEDILRSYNTYANAYVTKPVDLLRFMDVVRQIDDFFVTVVQHPR